MVKTAPMTRNTSRWRRPWLLAALVVLVALGLGAYRHFRGAAGQDLRTVPVTLGDLQVTVTAVGSLKPKDYVDVGTQVQEDTVVCIIEVMKLMHSITAGVKGTITAVCAENGEAVEKGQPLFMVRPESASDA